MAESMNAILKVELLLDQTFADHIHATEEVKKQIHYYNYQRPHGSIDYLTPDQAYDLTKPIPRRWEKYSKKITPEESEPPRQQ